MATTHIKLAKHLDQSPVKESDLKVGLEILYPSGLGGVFHYRCKSVDEHSALFFCLNKGWDYEVEMEFSQPDFNLEDFRALSAAIDAFNKGVIYPTDEQREKVRRAHVLGYASQLSYTQVHWTQLGINSYNQLTSLIRRILTEWPVSGEQSLTAAFTDVSTGYEGPCAVELDGKSTVVFPNYSEAARAACLAVNLDVGGYSEAVVMAATPGQRVTHQSAVDWIL